MIADVGEWAAGVLGAALILVGVAILVGLTVVHVLDALDEWRDGRPRSRRSGRR